VNNLKSSPSPTSGYDFPKNARISWSEMLEPDSCCPEGFEVENGVLGLERNVYLRIVKFLDSTIIRKV
jgi:hypothetical protein